MTCKDTGFITRTNLVLTWKDHLQGPITKLEADVPMIHPKALSVKDMSCKSILQHCNVAPLSRDKHATPESFLLSYRLVSICARVCRDLKQSNIASVECLGRDYGLLASTIRLGDDDAC
jgi:hypothetical protein